MRSTVHSITTGRVRLVVSLIFAASLAVPMLVGEGSPIVPLQAQGRGGVHWDHFVADITIHHGRVRDDGGPVPVSAPDSKLRFERARSGKTILTVLSQAPLQGPEGARPLTPKTSPAGMRIEITDGSSVRMFDPFGNEVRIPEGRQLERFLGSAAVPRDAPSRALDGATTVSGGASRAALDLANALIIPLAEREARARTLRTRYGRVAGTVRGLDRYSVVSGASVREILVDRNLALPVEINSARDGVLETQTTITYATFEMDTVVRQRLRTEMRLPDDEGERTVIEVTLDNMKFESRGGRK